MKYSKNFTGIALSYPEKRKQPKRKATIPESDLQAMAENLCLALGIRFFRIPDKLQAFLMNFAPTWTRVFVSRYFVGLPDLLLFKSTTPVYPDNIVRFIEIKTEVGKLSQCQGKWHSGLRVHVCYGWAETEKAIRDFAK